MTSDQTGNRNHFEFRIDTGIKTGRPRIWTCALDYQNGVAMTPVLKPLP